MYLKFNLINVFSNFSRWGVQNLKSEGTSLEIDLSSLHFFKGFSGYEIAVCNGNLAPSDLSQKLDNGMSWGGAMVNVGLGSLDRDVSQVLLGPGTLGFGMVVRASFKKNGGLYDENDPHLGENGR